MDETEKKTGETKAAETKETRGPQSCKKCGAPVREEDVFCPKCGAKHEWASAVYESKISAALDRRCPNCGNLLREAARYCDLCGHECVKIRRERKRKEKKRGCLALLFLFAVVWIIAGLSGVALYNTYKDKSLKEAYVFTRHKIARLKNIFTGGPSPASGDKVTVPPGDASGDEEPQKNFPWKQTSRPASVDAATPPIASEEENGADAETSGETASGDVSAADFVLTVSGEPAAGETPDIPEIFAGAASGDETGVSPDVSWTTPDDNGYSVLTETPLAAEVTGDHVRVRSMPNTDARIRGQFDKGASVRVTRRYASGHEPFFWFEVRDGKTRGWMYGEFLKLERGVNRVEKYLEDTD
jgi:RNA polymerase subunit RPABC4/transcription elongation factor Spt4